MSTTSDQWSEGQAAVVLPRMTAFDEIEHTMSTVEGWSDEQCKVLAAWIEDGRPKGTDREAVVLRLAYLAGEVSADEVRDQLATCAWELSNPDRASEDVPPPWKEQQAS